MFGDVRGENDVPEQRFASVSKLVWDGFAERRGGDERSFGLTCTRRRRRSTCPNIGFGGRA